MKTQWEALFQNWRWSEKREEVSEIERERDKEKACIGRQRKGEKEKQQEVSGH